MKPIMRGTAAQLVAGVLLGVVAGVLGIHFGFLSAVLALVVVILFGFAIGRSRGASAGLVGLGGTWFVLMLNALTRCPASSTDCGGGDSQVAIAWLTVSGAIVVVGIAIAVLGLTRRKDGEQSRKLRGES
jgi:hypothetical protein